MSEYVGRHRRPDMVLFAPAPVVRPIRQEPEESNGGLAYIALAILAVSAVVLGGLLAKPVRASAATECGTSIVQHSTGPNLAPSNTVPGIYASAAQGAETVEMDVRFNKSNFAWLSHDDDLSANTDAPAGTLISNSWMGDIQKWSAADYAPWNTDSRYAGYNADGTPKSKVPYTYDFLYALKQTGVKALFDVKLAPNRAQMDNLIGYLDRPEFKDALAGKITWMANSVADLTLVRSWYPTRFSYMLLESPSDQTIRRAQTLTGIGASAYAVPNYRMDKPASDYWHAFGLKSYAWTTNAETFDTTAERARLAAAGVDVIITNYSAQAENEICGKPLPAGAKKSR